MLARFFRLSRGSTLTFAVVGHNSLGFGPRMRSGGGGDRAPAA
jgi:hypothetical protein